MNVNKSDVICDLKNCILFKGMKDEQILSILDDNLNNIKKYAKSQTIFDTQQKPSKLYILISGKVSIFKNTFSGKKILMTNIEHKGDIFGEIYLFMDKPNYEVEAETLEKSIILEISNKIFVDTKKVNLSEIECILLHNIMNLFARKAFFLSNKVRLLGSSSIRGKIAYFLIERQDINGKVVGNLKREYMAEYLSVPRPSLSRELSNMAKENIIKLDGKNIIILNQGDLEEYL